MQHYRKFKDEELLSLLKDSDEKAFDMLYSRYETLLGKYALQITHNMHDAADMVQNIFVSLWNRRETLTITYSLKAWLYQALRYQSVKYIEQNVRKHHFLEGLALFLQSEDNNSPDVLLEGNQIQNSIDELVKQMPEKMRTAYLLSRDGQLSHREISEAMHISENTVKKHIHNALKIIKSEIPSYGIIISLALDKLLS